MTEEKPKRTELSEVGEFGLIDHLTKKIEIKHTSTLKGVGDDAAVLDYGNKTMLLSTDLLIEGVHFDLTYVPLKHFGYKAAIVNFSDIAAMNGTPKHITVNISVSNRFSLEALEELYSGILLACNKYQVDLIGGDTTSSTSGLYISITVVGEADRQDITYRDTAKEKDLICVSGDLGAAYIGLLLLEREKAVFKGDPNMQPDLEGYDYMLERQLKPEARTDIPKLLKELEIKPQAMIDISDGLASDLLHICKQSKVGCNIYEEKIPIDITTANLSNEFQIDPTTAAMNGGEDYELLFTIKMDDYKKIEGNSNIIVIGHIIPENEGINLISKSGTVVPVSAQGWDALKR